jgi:hypothetical protein
MARRIMQTVVNQISSPHGARAGLFIWEVKGLIIMSLITYPTNRVRGQVPSVHYIETPLYNVLMRCWRVSMLAQRPSICHHRDTFDSRLSVAEQWDLSSTAPAWTFTWELPGFFGHLQNTFGCAKMSWVWYPNWRGLRLTPNSSLVEHELRSKITNLD